MGIIYDSHVQFTNSKLRLNGDWMVEARTESIAIGKSLDAADIEGIEVNYEDLDDLEAAVKFAQFVRRDKGGPDD